MPHIYNLVEACFCLDELQIGRDIIFSYVVQCEVPVLCLTGRVFNMLERIRCTSSVRNPHIIALIN